MSVPSTQDGRIDAREREILAELVARLETADASSTDAELVRRVLAAADTPVPRRLRLVSDEPAKSDEPDEPKAVPRLRRLVVGAAVVAAAAALAVVVIRKPQPVAATPPDAAPGAPVQGQLARSEIVLASGEVFVGDAAARVGSGPLAVGDRVRTGQGRACLSIDPRIDVCLGTETEISLRSLAEERIEVNVVRGVAVAALEHRRPGQAFSLLGDDVSATAKGTVFALQRDNGHSPTVIVLEGTVEVAAGRDAKATVVAHTRWAGDAAPSGPVAVGRSEEGRFLELLSARPLWHPIDLGVVDVRGTPGDARIDAEGPLTMPFQSFIPAGSHQIILRTPNGEETTVDVDIAAGQTRVIDAASLFAAPRRGARVETGRGRQELLDEARKQLETGHAAEALQVYRKIERDFSTSSEATMVLVTIGKLEMRQGSPARALAAFDGYLRRGGPLAPEAYKGRIDALRALGRATQERSAIEGYLSKYPDGFDSEALKKRLAVLSHP
jgi:hypothetical protein